MPNYTYECTECGTSEIHNVKIVDRDNLHVCMLCGTISAVRMIDAPNIMETALPDGTRRRGWDKFKEAAKLNTEAAGAKQGAKKEIEKEIKKLGVRMNKPVI